MTNEERAKALLGFIVGFAGFKKCEFGPRILNSIIEVLDEAELRGEKIGLERAAEIVFNTYSTQACYDSIRKAASEIRASCEAGSQRDR